MEETTPNARSRRKLKRTRGLSIREVIPNAITVAATCAALTGLRFAIEGAWGFAVGAVVIAAVLDALDGRMARILNATSEFGAQLDSLSDFVSFGVVPALILYFWSLNGLGGFGWAVALLLTVCCGLRLARFNSRIDTLPSFAYNFFQGVPAPAGAGLALLPIAASLAFGEAAVAPPWLTGLWTVAVGLLMVSELPTYSFKKVKVPRRLLVPLMLLFGLTLAGLAGQPWDTIVVMGVIYLALIPFSVMSYKKLKDEADRLQETQGDLKPDAGEKNGDARGGADGGPPTTLRSIK